MMVAALMLGSIAGCSTAKPAPVREPVATTKSTSDDNTIRREEAVSVEARVTAINQKTRAW
jgi:hypothetical protein